MPAHPPERINQCASFTDVFLQLGLPSTPQAIADFIVQHGPLPGHTELADAPFWNPAQAQFIREKMLRDEPPWSLLLDQLSEALRW